jgi:hypothetical protein
MAREGAKLAKERSYFFGRAGDRDGKRTATRVNIQI